MGAVSQGVKRTFRRLGVDISRHRPTDGWEIPRDFPDHMVETIRAVEAQTMTSAERIEGLVSGVEWIEQQAISGAIVECGVWRGGSTMAAALTLLRLGSTDRDLYLYDTFAGMTDPEPVDLHYHGLTAEETLAEMEPDATSMSDWCNASLGEVQTNLASTGYPPERISYVEGPVEETIPDTLPGPIALLRLDTDFYSSTKHELEHLYPLVAPRGVVIIDDYGAWQGARRAVDEFLADREGIFLHRLDMTGRLFIKPS